MKAQAYIFGLEIVHQEISGQPLTIRVSAKDFSGQFNFEFEMAAQAAKDFHVGDELLITVGRPCS